MINFILDTTILIDLLRQSPIALQWSTTVKMSHGAITPIAWMETVDGARDKTERAQILIFLRQFRLKHSTQMDNQWAMLQFSHFRLSHGVEFTDMMIASVAARLQVPLYTLNLKHYAPLPGINEFRPY